MASCTVNYNLKDAGYSNFANQVLWFRLKSAGTDENATSIVARSRLSSMTDSNGDGSVTLWVNGDSGVESIYEVQLPGRERIDFIIPSGTSTIELDRLIELYQPTGSEQQPSVLATALDRSLHTGGPDDLNGNEIILDEDGDTSITADTDDRIDFKIGGTDWLQLTSAKALQLENVAGAIQTDGAFLVSDGATWTTSGLVFEGASGLQDVTIAPPQAGNLDQYDITVRGGENIDNGDGGDLFLLGGIGATGPGGDTYLRGGTSAFSTDGNIYIGDSDTNAIYWGSGSVDVSTITAFAATLLDDANLAAAQTTLGIAVPATLAKTDQNVLLGDGSAWTSSPSAELAIPSRAPVAQVQAGSTASALTVPDAATVDVGTGDFSVFAWVKIDSTVTGNQTILEKYTTTGFKVEVTSTGGLRCNINGTLNTTASVDLRDNKWHFICFTHDRSDVVTYYVDGVAIDTDDISPTMSDDLDNSATVKMLGDEATTGLNEGWACNYIGLTKDILTASEVNLIAANPHDALDLDNLALLVDVSQIEKDQYIDRSANAAAVTISGSTSVVGFPLPEIENAADTLTDNDSAIATSAAIIDYMGSLGDIRTLAVTDGNFIVGDGTNWVAESGATARTSLGLGSAAVLNQGDSSAISQGEVLTLDFNAGDTDDLDDASPFLNFKSADGGLIAQTAAEQRANLGILSASATLDFPSVSSSGSQNLTITVTGATVGSAVQLAPPSTIEANLVWCGFVSATNTVTVRMTNASAAPIDPASATWGVIVTPLS